MQHKAPVVWIKTSLLLAVALTAMTGAIMSPALPDMSDYFNRPEGDFLARLILTMPALVNAILAPGIGWITDKFGRRKLLLISICIYFFAGISGFFIQSLSALLFVRAIFGVGVAGIIGASTTMIGDYFEGFERNRFMGIQSAMLSLSGVVFVNISGVLAEWSWRGPFLMYSFALLVLPVCFAYLQTPKKVQGNNRIDKVASPLSKSSRIIVTIRILVMGILGMMAFYMTPVQIPFLLKSIGFDNNVIIGFCISVSTLTGTITSFSFGKLRTILHYRYLYFISFMLCGIGYLLIGFESSLYGIIAGLAISGLGMGLLMPTGNLWVMDITPLSHRGRLISYLSAAIFLGQFSSPLVTAIPIQEFGIINTFTYGGILIILLGSINLIKLGKSIKPQNL